MSDKPLAPNDNAFAPDVDGGLNGFIVDVRFKKTHPLAKLPTKAYHVDNCYDLYAVERTVIPSGGSAVVPVGLSLAHISPGFGFTIKPRSGLGFKHNIQPHLGEIDNGYRGDLGVKLYNFSNKLKVQVDIPQLDISNSIKTGATSVTAYTEPNYYETDVLVINPGDRIAQFKIERVWYSQVSFTETASISDRGENGFGSSGS